jgi:hypothetical protein
MVKLGIILLVKLNSGYWRQKMTNSALALCAKRLMKLTPVYSVYQSFRFKESKMLTFLLYASLIHKLRKSLRDRLSSLKENEKLDPMYLSTIKSKFVGFSRLSENTTVSFTDLDHC